MKAHVCHHETHLYHHNQRHHHGNNTPTTTMQRNSQKIKEKSIQNPHQNPSKANLHASTDVVSITMAPRKINTQPQPRRHCTTTTQIPLPQIKTSHSHHRTPLQITPQPRPSKTTQTQINPPSQTTPKTTDLDPRRFHWTLTQIHTATTDPIPKSNTQSSRTPWTQTQSSRTQGTISPCRDFAGRKKKTTTMTLPRQDQPQMGHHCTPRETGSGRQRDRVEVRERGLKNRK